MRLEGQTPATVEALKSDLEPMDHYILSRLADAASSTDKALEAYRFSDAASSVYQFFWHEFCDWYIELVKSRLFSDDEKSKAAAQSTLVYVLDQALRMLHPFMPFLSEELWHNITERTKGEALVVSSWPTASEIDDHTLSVFSHTMEMITSIRSIRKQKNIPTKVPMQLLQTSSQAEYYENVISKLANIDSFQVVKDLPQQLLPFRVGTAAYYLPFSVENPEEEISKLKEELNYQKGFLVIVQKKLSNTRFVDNAPKQVVQIERKKETEAIEKISQIEKQIAKLQG